MSKELNLMALQDFIILLSSSLKLYAIDIRARIMITHFSILIKIMSYFNEANSSITNRKSRHFETFFSLQAQLQAIPLITTQPQQVPSYSGDRFVSFYK